VLQYVNAIKKTGRFLLSTLNINNEEKKSHSMEAFAVNPEINLSGCKDYLPISPHSNVGNVYDE